MPGKVVAYITHGNRLLVFRHVDFVGAGIQVPAGTVEANETSDAAALREAREETGLSRLTLLRYLGEDTVELPTGPARRSFYHLRCEEVPPEMWRHGEFNPSGGGGPIVFELYWVSLDDVPALAGRQDLFLSQLGR